MITSSSNYVMRNRDEVKMKRKLMSCGAYIQTYICTHICTLERMFENTIVINKKLYKYI